MRGAKAGRDSPIGGVKRATRQVLTIDKGLHRYFTRKVNYLLNSSNGRVRTMSANPMLCGHEGGGRQRSTSIDPGPIDASAEP